MSARVAVEYIPPLHFMPTCPTVVVLSSTYRTMRRERDRTLTKSLAWKKKWTALECIGSLRILLADYLYST